MSPVPTSLLLDPLPELLSALSSNAWGLGPSPSRILPQASFPLTETDRAEVLRETRETGRTSTRVVGRAEVGVEEGVMGVVLDRRGFTVESGSTPHLAPFVGRTYESFEALLIGVSPVYVRKMTEEVGRRFAERLEGVREEHDPGEGDEGQDGEDGEDGEEEQDGERLGRSKRG
ncbi:hypothetical protein EHS25_010148 [Saitozyma podzolica]|uniref:GSKIP domain-containing protein n=1 Tax=Saitozyma podzolica TaxID=1890683 RepID=A0A427YIR0_9TREE|nr:hypothetical protein EHS25_010148 [Saitozyma podzolica]